MRAILLASTVLAVTALAMPAKAQGSCGASEELDPGETVVEMADRCGTTVEAILAANGAETVDDLNTDGALLMRSAAAETEEALDDAADATGEAADDAGRALDDAAESASDMANDAAEATGQAARDAGEALDNAIDEDTVDEAADQAEDWLGRARVAVQEAGKRIEEGATAAGRNASEYLSQNPDLNQDIIRLGESIGLPGMTSEPHRGPELIAEGSDNGRVRLEAFGLPGDTEVNIGLKHPDDSIEVLETAMTGENGGLSVEIETPSELTEEDGVTFVIETSDERLRLASEPYMQP